MIKANELRKGNYVIYHSDEEEFAATNGNIFNKIDAEDVFLIDTKQGYAELHSPIQLSPEWLSKSGFTHAMDNIYGGWLSPKVNGEQIRIQVNTIGLFFYTTNRMSRPVYIDTVHQLQNIFFALTGEELTVNL